MAAGDFLGGRIIEVTPGGSSIKPGDTNVVELQASYKKIEGNWHVLNEQTGEYEGFDIDVATEIATRLAAHPGPVAFAAAGRSTAL